MNMANRMTVQQYWSYSRSLAPTQFGLLSLIQVLIAFIGLIQGALWGHARFGGLGLFSGLLAGLFVGGTAAHLLINILPNLYAGWKMTRRSVEELRRILDSRGWSTDHNLALFQLAVRDEDIGAFLPRILEQLASESVIARLMARDSILLFPDFWEKLERYNPLDPFEACKEKVSAARASAGAEGRGSA